MSNVESIRPEFFPWFDYSRYTFSLGLTDGRTAWLSGHSASEYDPGEQHIVVRGGIEKQTRTAFAKILAILEASSLRSSDVTRVVEYVTVRGIDEYPAVEQVRSEVFGRHRPAVCVVVVNRLLRPQALIEIEVTAQRSESGRAESYDEVSIVYLPSLIASENGKEIEPGSDLIDQTRRVFERASALLAAAGLDASHIVKTVDYTTPATLSQYRNTASVRRDFLGPVYPAAAGILLSKLQHPNALISLDVIASRTTPKAVNPGWERYSKLTYSPAVIAGKYLFMSGQAALDPASEKAVFHGDIAAQAEYTYANVIEVLKAAGAEPSNLVKTIEYVTPPGLERYREVAAVREKLLVAPYPASTGVVCESLLRPEFEFEVDPFAVLD